jgi:hypothetical protein
VTCGGGCRGCAEELEDQDLPAKLNVSAPDDPLELEADIVAEQILSMGANHDPVTQRANGADHTGSGRQSPASLNSSDLSVHHVTAH